MIIVTGILAPGPDFSSSSSTSLCFVSMGTNSGQSSSACSSSSSAESIARNILQIAQLTSPTLRTCDQDPHSQQLRTQNARRALDVITSRRVAVPIPPQLPGLGLRTATPLRHAPKGAGHAPRACSMNVGGIVRTVPDAVSL